MKKTVNCASIGVNLPEELARDVDAMFQSLPLECKSYQRKAMIADSITFEPGERAEVSIITTNSVDKSDEVVLPIGVNFDVYRKNPVVLWNHDKHFPPCGNCTWIKCYNDESIRAKTQYPERTEPDPDRPWFIDEVWDMIRAGILRSKSIGFLPTTPKRPATPDEILAHPDWQNAGVWDACNLIEYSCCTVGVNNDALVTAINTKSFDRAKLLEIGLQVAEAQEEAVPEAAPVVLSFVQKALQEPLIAERTQSLIEKGMNPDEAALLAIATTKAWKARPKKKVIKKLSPDEIMAKAIDAVKINPRAIVKAAIQAWKNRGDV